MKRRLKTQPATTAPAVPEEQLYVQVRHVLAHARGLAHRSVNQAMVQAYWQVGRLIVEHEQAGQARAAYGARQLEALGQRLTQEFGRGFSAANLRNFRQFFQTYGWTEICDMPCRELSWSHLRRLMRVADPQARAWYAAEAVSQTWSFAALDRQISTLHYERLLSSQDKAALQAEAAALVQRDTPPDPRDFIRDPYVLDFLGARPGAALYEQDMEKGLLDNLQRFLLELGKGFAFVARQKHLRIEDEDAFVDLVFYNYILKCFVLVELKVGKLSHQDVGQLDMYVRVFDERERQPGDNPTIGLILCSERNAAVARYSRLADGDQLFASRYQAYLPTEAELQAELARERALLGDERSRDR
ncbi:PDDEXK nuclease domain-containing protein [uncultured Aquincola sp.]|uniref:PDDEXK nuclease domain-containing protein n=1 Tax=uncultured Aquincola sp. TaxID=886556 RepID=UPI0032B304C8